MGLAPPNRLRIATGSTQGAYHAFALELAAEFAREDITLAIIETAGSMDNLGRLVAGQTGIALVQSGLSGPEQQPEREGLD